ncbi:MAG TPA: SCO family protein [Streptosporangiaceae bacterium]|nr:SCO family protein [Streptosporangiaceae bacterium]
MNVHNRVVVGAFHAALIHQAIIALLIFGVLAAFWATSKAWRPARLAPERAGASAGAPVPEAPARKLLRVGFGVLWIFDGLLQAQSAMAIGLTPQVIEPVAATSPPWVQHVANWGGTSWSYHPVQAGAAAVWIQVGLGLWLLAAPRGWSSRLAGLASLGWGMVVWVFGEVFGGIFAGGQSWMFGAPGAVIFYSAAGLLIACPERAWATARLGRTVLAVLGVFFVGMSVLQAWPGRGFWQGTAHGHPGPLADMAGQMSQVPQPTATSRLVAAFGSFDAGHGLAVNLFVVVTLAAIGVSLLIGHRRLLGPTMIVVAVLCVADWIFIQDFGFFGGVGTDPNSMIPLLLLVTSGYVAMTRVPEAVAEPVEPGERRLGVMRKAIAAPSLSLLASVGALGVMLLGAGPMAAAQADSKADPILAEAVNGPPTPANRQAPGFDLTDQQGHRRSLASLRGKVVFLTFLDPGPDADSRLIAQELRTAARMLSGNSGVEVLAVTLSPVQRSVATVNAFDRREGMTDLPNWLFLTGSAAQLRQVWQEYSVVVQQQPGGDISHNDVAYVVDRSGNIRFELDTTPGPGTAATTASFAALFVNTTRQALTLK